MLLLRTVINRIFKNPVQFLLTIAGISLGVAVVAQIINLIQIYEEYYPTDTKEIRFSVINGSIAGNSYNMVDKPVFDTDDMASLKNAIPELKIITPIYYFWADRLQINNDLYRPNCILGVDVDYLDLYTLKMASGSFITKRDVAEKNRVMVISNRVARIIFGNPAEAVGKTVFMLTKGRTSDSSMERWIKTTYKVVGVFNVASLGKQTAFGIADFLIPYTLKDFNGKTVNRFVGLITGRNIANVKAKAIEVFTQIHGVDTQVAIWEGHPQDPSENAIKEMRVIPKMTLIFFGTFGFVALLTSTFGIFSVMLIDISERSREIGLRCALGSTKHGIVVHFILEAIIYVLIGSVVGLILAFVFNKPVIEAIRPSLAGTGLLEEVPVSAFLGFKSCYIAILAAIFAGGISSLIPAISAAKVLPIESLREN